MNLEQLRCLCAIVEEGSFRRAADLVHRSQPAVSQQLKALEKELKHVLIERKTGRPTPLGRLVYERAKNVLLDVHALENEVDDLSESVERELRVGSSDTTALYILPPHLKLLAQQLPRTRFTLVNRSSAAIAELVGRGELDLGIVTLPVGRDDLEESVLFEQRLVLVLPEHHPLSRGRSLRLDRLQSEPLLQLDPHTRTGALLNAFFQEQRFTPRVVLDSGSFEVIKRYVAEGLGISFLPESVVQRGSAGLVTRPLPGLPSVTIGAVWRRDTYLSKGARMFVEMLQQMTPEKA